MAWHCHRTPPGWLFLVDLSCRSFFDGVFKFTGTPLCVQSEMLVILSSLFKQINMDSQCGVQTQVSQLSLPLLQSSLINWRNPGALGVRCDEFGPLSSVTTVNTADLHAPILINHAWPWQRSVWETVYLLLLRSIPPCCTALQLTQLSFIYLCEAVVSKCVAPSSGSCLSVFI